MKKKILFLSIVLSLGYFTVNSSPFITSKDFNPSENHILSDKVKKSIKVYGNCGMCKELIQKAAKSVKGVHSAEWDEKTKILELSYSENVDIQDIHKAIANVGYDTEEVKAKDEAYNKLHKCCQYERAEQK